MFSEQESGSTNRDLLPSQQTGEEAGGAAGGAEGGEAGGAEGGEAEGDSSSCSDEPPHYSVQTEERPPQSRGAKSQGEEKTEEGQI